MTGGSLQAALSVVLLTLLLAGTSQTFASTSANDITQEPSITSVTLQPAKPYQNMPLNLIVNVTSRDAGIDKAILSHKAADRTSWKNETMEQIRDAPPYSTFKVTIPAHNASAIDYKLFFIDYYGNKGEYASRIKLEKDDTSPYLREVTPQAVRASWNYVVVSVHAGDTGSGIKDVVMYYWINSDKETLERIPMSPMFLDQIYENSAIYHGRVPVLPQGTMVNIQVNATDNGGMVASGSAEYVVHDPVDMQKTVSGSITFKDFDPINRTVNVTFAINAYFPSNKTVDYIYGSNLGNGILHKLARQGFDYNYYTPSQDVQQLRIIGSESDYPFDRYFTNFELRIPFTNVTSEDFRLYFDGPTESGSWTMTVDGSEKWEKGGETIIRASLSFTRTQDALLLSVFPILAFFVLGSMVLIRGRNGMLGRISIIITLFSLVFALSVFVNEFRSPNIAKPALSDILTSQLILSTIIYAIGSSFSFRFFNNRKTDVVTFAVTAFSLIIALFIMQGTSYRINSILVSTQTLAILGLGYGIVIQYSLAYYRKRQHFKKLMNSFDV